MEDKKISIVIPTYNSAKTLEKCLVSINKQTYKAHEVIVVDQKSADATVEIARNYQVTVLTADRPQIYTPPTKSRNMGAKSATGDYLIHLDSDMMLFDDCLQKCIESAQRNNLEALVIHEVDVYQGFWAAAKALERSCYIGDSNIEAARCVTKNLFEKVGGYDEAINSGEDWDIHSRYVANGSVGDSGAFLYHNLGKITLWSQLRKKFNYGRSSLKFLRKQSSTGQGMGKHMLKAYLRNYQKFLLHPFLALGFVFLRVSETIAIYLGIHTNALGKS